MNHKKFFYKMFLLLFPVIVSFYLFFHSPNILKEIHNENASEYVLHLQENLDVWRKQENQNPKTQDLPSILHPQKQEFAVFFCSIEGDTVSLKPFIVDIAEREDKITALLEQLFDKPGYLDPKYQTLIPSGTRLLDYELNAQDQSVTLNLNEVFLNTVSGDDGKKLKIAQLLYTLHSMHTIHTVYVHINGKAVPFLDRDGILLNRPFHLADIHKLVRD